MAKDSEDIIQRFGNQLVINIRKAIPSATGKTAASVNITFTKTGFIIRGGAQIGALIDGRKPTSAGAVAGNPTVREAILEWIRARRIKPKEASMSEASLAFLIARSIHRNGYKGNPNLFKNVLTQSKLNSVTKQLAAAETTFVASDLIKQFKSK